MAVNSATSNDNLSKERVGRVLLKMGVLQEQPMSWLGRAREHWRQEAGGGKPWIYPLPQETE